MTQRSPMMQPPTAGERPPTRRRLAHRVPARVDPDPARVVARLFLPGEELHQTRSRAGQIVERIMALSEAEVVRLADRLVADFAPRHRAYAQLLAHHASVVAAHLGEEPDLSEARTLLLGASFTAEYSTEGAALCNPSAVLHPDQSDLGTGQARVAVSLRSIGEGHISSIGFCTAIVGPSHTWRFVPRALPATAGAAAPATWRRKHFRAVLADQAHLDELAEAVLHALPIEFESTDLERALAEMHHDLLVRPGSSATVDVLRRMVASAYLVSFPDAITLDQQVLIPSAAEESNGMEDARFTRFVDDDGAVEYRATYTAYDGQRIAPRLLTSRDLRTFRAHRLAGTAARNKGMALFPRLVGGRHLALCRSDGESTSLAASDDGYTWTSPELLQGPSAAWELLQVGNCGPPIETERGWLVLTHGVGPMRSYSIGAILLDLEDPSRIVGRLDRPLLEPADDERDGYVPNVVYSCGALVHDGLLWMPFGIDDAWIGVAYVVLTELLDELSTTS
jgi:predicted GH43/DUF377 family glycosyl hydrolase